MSDVRGSRLASRRGATRYPVPLSSFGQNVAPRPRLRKAGRKASGCGDCRGRHEAGNRSHHSGAETRGRRLAPRGLSRRHGADDGGAARGPSGAGSPGAGRRPTASSSRSSSTRRNSPRPRISAPIPARRRATGRSSPTLGPDLLFAPAAAEIYPPGFDTKIVVGGPAAGLETDFRPHFFAGVATVVAKLLLAGLPDRAYFGEKDFQQLLVVKQLVRDLNIPTEIVGCATIREPDGLALSSRNVYLSADERARAPRLNARVARDCGDACEPVTRSTGACRRAGALWRRPASPSTISSSATPKRSRRCRTAIASRSACSSPPGSARRASSTTFRRSTIKSARAWLRVTGCSPPSISTRR